MTREVNYFRKDSPGPWALEAACRGSTGTHFPDAPMNTLEYERQVARAKLICSGCPVKTECFELAVNNNERDGVWGGEIFPRGGRSHRRRLAKLAKMPTDTDRSQSNVHIA